MNWDPTENWWLLAIVSATLFAMEATAILSAFHALRNVRTSQAAVAWTVGLLTFPFIALPLYWVFARHRFEGYREAIRDVGERHQQSVLAVQRELQTEDFARSTKQVSPLDRLADVLDTPVSHADESRLLIDGQAFFDAMHEVIRNAKDYIYVAFFIIRDDRLGNQFADALIESAQRGVTVRLLYDEVGCLRLSRRYLKRLRDAGIDVLPFNTRQGWVNRFQINFRNHRKIVLADGETAVVGGLNIGDEYLGPPNRKGRWRDTGIQVSGPITRKIQAVFAGDYYWSARKDLPEAIWNPPNAPAQHAPAQHAPNAVVCATGPADLRPKASMMFGSLAGSARHRLWISTPYLVPDEPCMLALHMARARGVDVRLLIPNEADHWAVYLAGFYYEHELIEASIPVYRFTDGFLHQKCVLVDDDLALIGSTNLDNRSLYLNFELMIAVAEKEIVSEVREMMEQDFEDAFQSYSEGAPRRWWFERAGTAIARLFSPVL